MAKIFAQFADGTRREANEDTAGRFPADWIDACRRNEAPGESTLENWLLMAGLDGDYCEIDRDTGRVWCGRGPAAGYDQGYLLSQEECDEYMARIERGV